MISGYKGGNDVYLAMERGEVHGRCGGLISSIKSTRPDWFPQKKVSVPIQIALERDPEFPDSPALIEFAKDQRTKDILQLILAPMGMDRPILAPPGTPPAIGGGAAQGLPRDHDRSRPSSPRPTGSISRSTRSTATRSPSCCSDAYALPPDVVKAANEAMALTGAANEN